MQNQVLKEFFVTNASAVENQSYHCEPVHNYGLIQYIYSLGVKRVCLKDVTSLVRLPLLNFETALVRE